MDAHAHGVGNAGLKEFTAFAAVFAALSELCLEEIPKAGGYAASHKRQDMRERILLEAEEGESSRLLLVDEAIHSQDICSVAIHHTQDLHGVIHY